MQNNFETYLLFPKKQLLLIHILSEQQKCFNINN